MLRKLVLAFANWLFVRAYMADTTRIPMGGDVVSRSERWEQFAREQGGLYDMLADIRREAFEAAGELDPKDTDKIYYWAMADRNVRKLEQRVQAVIAAGKIEAHNREQMQRINAAKQTRKSVI